MEVPSGSKSKLETVMVEKQAVKPGPMEGGITGQGRKRKRTAETPVRPF